MSEYAVEATGLRKTYGDVVALDGVDIRVPTGTVTAILGPNGAGKSTTVKILATLLEPDSGEAWVAGCNVLTQGHEVRQRVGLTAQDATLDEVMTGRENLVMIGKLYGLDKKTADERADKLLVEFGLADAGDNRASTYSGGMRRRLDLAATLIDNPQVLFLDEPTTGLDPRGRLDLWQVLDSLVATGTTILLTTQYLEEAERLAQDIVVIDHGRVIAQGDSATLKSQVGGDHVHVLPVETADGERIQAVMRRVTGHEPAADPTTNGVVVPVDKGLQSLVDIASALETEGIAVVDIGMRQPTLDEVFLELTGKPMEDGEQQ